MAVTLIAGIASVGSAMVAAGAFAIGWGAAFTAFAIGAGLSMVSRALMPKPDLGTQMGGRSVMTREAASSRKIIYGRARVGGNVVYLESTGTDNKYLWLVTAIAGHEIDAYEEVWFNDKKIWDGGSYVGNWGSYVDIGFYKGDQTSADNASQRGAASLVSNSTKWTDNHKLLDTAYMVVKLTYDQEQFAQGLPNISTVVRGKKVWHPNNSSPVWSQNPALCLRDYLTDTKYGLGESTANIASINTAFGVCNETVALAAGGTQPRYTMDGVIDTADSIKANIENMTGAMIGRLIYSGGKFEIHAGEYVAPTVTIDESMMVGEISVQTKQSRRNAYNGVKGVFLSEEDNYILADYPAQISSTYATQDGDPIYLDMPLPYTVNNVRAQRIAKLALLRSRQQEAITIPCNLNAFKFKIGDNINVSNTRLGYSSKVFEVVGYSFGFSSDQMVVNVEAIETASSIWDWATSDEEVFLGAGEVDLYDGTNTAAPTNLTVTADSYLADDGTYSPYFNVTWDYSDDAFVDHYIVEWRTGTNDYYSQTTKTKPFEIRSLQQGASYDIRVKAVNEINVHSAYLTGSQTPATDTTAPDVPTSVSAVGEYRQITISWTNPTQKDLLGVEVFRSDTETGTYLYVGNGDSSFIDTDLETPKTYYYKVRSYDRSFNKSNYAAIVSATSRNVTITAPDNSEVVIYDGESGIPPSVTNAVATTSSDTNTFYLKQDYKEHLELHVSYPVGALTSGTVSGETNAINAVMSQFKFQIYYAPTSNPTSFTQFGSDLISQRKTTTGQLISNYFVKTTDLGSGNYKAELQTKTQVRTAYPTLSGYQLGIIDDDYNLTEITTVYDFPPGEYVFKVVVTVTDGSYSLYPATGSPLSTLARTAKAIGYQQVKKSGYSYAFEPYYQPTTIFRDRDSDEVVRLSDGADTLEIAAINAQGKPRLLMIGPNTTNPSSGVSWGASINFVTSFDSYSNGGLGEYQIGIDKSGTGLYLGSGGYRPQDSGGSELKITNGRTDVFGDLYLNGVEVGTGSGTITGITAGTNLNGGGTSGAVTLNLDNNISLNNLTLTGYLRGPSTFTIDPATHGDDTGTLVIAGNLQVDGTQTTVNSTVVEISDLNFKVAKDAANASAANGAGLTVGGADAQLKYIAVGDKWTMNKDLDVSGSVTATEYDLPSGGMLDWANGDARIQEGLVNNYSLSFLTYDGSTCSPALRLDGNNNATFHGNISTTGSSITVDPASGDAILSLQGAAGAQTLRLDQNSIRTSTNSPITFLTNNTNALTLDTSQNAIFSGTVTADKLSSQKLTSGNGGLRIHSSGTKIFAITEANAVNSGAMDLGASDAKFKDLYLSGTINSGAITSSGKIEATQLDLVGTDNYIAYGSAGTAPSNGDYLRLRDVATGNDALQFYMDSSKLFSIDGQTGNAYHKGTISSGAITSSGSVTASTSMLVGDGEAYGFGDNSYRIEGKDDGANARIGFVAGGSEKMRLTSTGLGIGTSSPSSELTIGADTPQIDLLKTSSADVLANIRAETDAGSGGKLVFQTKRNGNTALDRMTIDDDGSVGINTSSPSAKLHLKASNNAYSGGFRIEGTDETTALAITHVNGDNFFSGNGTDDHLALTGSGNVQIKSAGKLQAFRSDNARSILVYTDNDAATVESDTDPLKIKSANRIQFETGGANERMRIDLSGRVGINRTPSISNSKLEVGGADNVSLINVEASGNTGGMGIGSSGLQFFHGSSSKMTIGSDGFIQATSASQVRLTLGSTGTAGTNSSNWIRGTGSNLGFNSAGGNIHWEVSGSEKMRLDGGNLLVGKTSTSYAVEGIALRGDNAGVQSTVTDEACFTANRLNSDGRLILFAQDTATVGEVGTSGDELYIGKGDTTLLFNESSDAVLPRGTNGAQRNGAIQLGSNSNRFSDLYLSGTISSGAITSTGNSSHGGYSSWTAGSGTGGIFMHYNSSNSYRSYFDWRTLQLGNNGANNILFGNSATGGYAKFYVNSSSISQTGGTSGTHAFSMLASGEVVKEANERFTIKSHSNGWAGGMRMVSSNGGTTFQMHPDDNGWMYVDNIWNFTGDIKINGDTVIGSNRALTNISNAAENGSSVFLKTASNGYLQINNWIRPANGSGLYYSAGVHFYETGNYMYSSTSLQANNDVRAPIFYDRDNTNYRVDSSGDSKLHKLDVNWLGAGRAPNSSGSYRLTMGGSIDMNNNHIHYADEVHFHSNTRFRDHSANYLDFRWGSSGSGGIRMIDQNENLEGYLYADAGNIGLLSSDGTWAVQCNTAQTKINHRIDTPMVYDIDNTAYYVDPAGTTILSLLRVDGKIQHTGDTDTYMEFNTANTWRVVAGGSQKLVVNSGGVNVNNGDLEVTNAIIAGGNITAYSDRKLKENIEPIENAVNKVQQLNGVTFNRNDLEDTSKRYAGLIAQDVEQVLPEAVEGEKTLAVDYNATIGLLVEAIKELKSEVDDLKTQLSQKEK